MIAERAGRHKRASPRGKGIRRDSPRQ